MSSLVSSVAALLWTSLLALLFGFPAVLGQDLEERDALCNADGCFVIYFQPKTFLESWKACKDKGGNLATIKRKEDAITIATLFSAVDLRHSRTGVKVWIGLQRQPRQCTSTRPLRGYAWATGDQDTEYTNWQREDTPNLCSVSRCVVMSYSTQWPNDNFKWLDGACVVSVDGYLCHYAYKGMCPALWNEGGGNALYTTPFNLISTLLTHVPFGSLATIPCPTGATDEQSVLCMQREDGSVGWSREPPLCSHLSISQNWCDQDNGGCEHFCTPAGDNFYCECSVGYQLGDDEKSCELSSACQRANCEFECLSLSDGHHCVCPDGYVLALDERSCLDIDECLESPCAKLCVNTPGSFECQCPEGYQLEDDGRCEDIDECINNPCHHVCENTEGSHICHCYFGYYSVPEEPSRCQDIDECQIPGTCEQMCENHDGGFECHCWEGFELILDHSSCQKREERDDRYAVTPAFPWVTDPPVSVWDYEWNPDWQTEEKEHLGWPTQQPGVLDSDVIWVTRDPQEEIRFDSVLDPLTQVTEKAETDRADLSEWGQKPQPELKTTTYSTPPTTIISSTTLDWYESDEDTAPIFYTTSTIFERALNWWEEFTTSSQSPGNPQESVTDHSRPTESSYHSESEGEGQTNLLRTNSMIVEEELRKEENDFVEITHSPTQPSLSEGGGSDNSLDSVQGERRQKQWNTRLLVGLLVPICIFIVVMVALGIVYCTRCAVEPRNKNATDCYHWISGAHDKQGAPNPSAGVKTLV